MPNWLMYLRIALVVIQLLKELNSGKAVDAGKVIKAVEPALPAKLKGNLGLLTAEDVAGVQDAFLTLGSLFSATEGTEITEIKTNL
jgi:hypothetical protein